VCEKEGMNSFEVLLQDLPQWTEGKQTESGLRDLQNKKRGCEALDRVTKCIFGIPSLQC
jgi:hypothetical protein